MWLACMAHARLPSAADTLLMPHTDVRAFCCASAAGGRSVPGMATAESFCHNSTTASLCSPAWQVGTAADPWPVSFAPWPCPAWLLSEFGQCLAPPPPR